MLIEQESLLNKKMSLGDAFVYGALSDTLSSKVQQKKVDFFNGLAQKFRGQHYEC